MVSLRDFVGAQVGDGDSGARHDCLSLIGYRAANAAAVGLSEHSCDAERKNRYQAMHRNNLFFLTLKRGYLAE